MSLTLKTSAIELIDELKNQIMKCVLLFPEGKDAILDFVDIFRSKLPTAVTPDLLCDIFRDCKSIDHLTSGASSLRRQDGGESLSNKVNRK